MSSYIVNRRTVLGGSAALGAAGLLAACGKKNTEAKQSLDENTDVKSVFNINEQPVSALKNGGELNLALTAMGSDFNQWSLSGGIADIRTALSPVYTAGAWISKYDGTPVLNTNFVQACEESEEAGKQVITYTLNPKAKFNDGTDFDVEAFKATWQIKRVAAGDYKILTPEMYPQIESVEAVDGDTKKVKVTFSTPYYPVSEIFSLIMHPKMTDKELFNNGFVNEPHSELAAGPFKVEKWDTSAKVLSLVPNENWWGDKPMLSKINFRSMELSAARAAFKNGELDAMAANSAASYTELNGTNGTDTRKGQYLFAGGLMLNPKKIEDAAVRKAIFLGTDREALAKIRFQNMPYEEKLSGSMIQLPLSKNYRDNYPKPDGDAKSAVAKVLEAAGYTKSGDYYAKDGNPLKISFTVFGDTAVNTATAQTFAKNMQAVGIDCEVDTQAPTNFSKVMSNKEYHVALSGYGVSADPTVATAQFYLSTDNNGVGNAEIDEMIKKMQVEKDDAKRAALCNDIEKKHMDEVSVMGTLFNGPNFVVCKKDLANYGAFLFETIDWTKVGWQK
ncbi:MAG: ABC transporter family substrate-binding protein [Rothia sp. (in: high G+C Gram-positive bacteria)]|uniref:ABC transporter family substrate-binding protein n=1 Tax=Rothia sp. (in: high G+C Gram-positive bacteria) TaxID=1885016 RepID=UPI0026E03690|nr:ABC transporter family substrate-binding protein [Rothia sp. (in: high G+C Gram-positive bacteria)]MDO5750526.1 ABC transporter family substrate-binding protein [Rothia sp. (in: high G+C Gram-positive bacteria)]